MALSAGFCKARPTAEPPGPGGETLRKLVTEEIAAWGGASVGKAEIALQGIGDGVEIEPRDTLAATAEKPA